MPALRIAVDLQGLDPSRPRGPARYARVLAEALRANPCGHEITLWEPGQAPGPADVVLALGGRPRLDLPIPTVAAVYDLAYLLAPATVPRLERARQGFATAWLTRRAAHLLAPSLAIANALKTYLRVPDSRLTWLPTVEPGWKRAPRTEVEAARRVLGAGDRYLIFIGTRAKRKNLGVLARAWELAAVDAELLLCGEGQKLGYLPDRQLHALLSGAVAWVSPSRFEGCSLGAVEAMACGTPPLVASGTAPAEIVGTAGIVIDPDDVEGWAAAIRTVVGDRDERNRMAARGLQAVRELSPGRAVPRLLQAAAAAAGAGI